MAGGRLMKYREAARKLHVPGCIELPRHSGGSRRNRPNIEWAYATSKYDKRFILNANWY
jgi:hypothetical protein